MVGVLRVDERLLHGQVAVSWINHVGPDAIVIANDEVMKDEFAKLALKMAKPEGMKLAIRSVADACNLLLDPATQNLKVFVLTKTIQDARRVIEAIGGIEYLNLGRCYSKNKEYYLTNNMPISRQSHDDLVALFDKVSRIEYQMVPSEKEIDVKKLFSN